MEDYFKCLICSQQDHDGIFCHCADRNIRIAREKRAIGDNWSSCRERLNPRDHNEDILDMVCDSPIPANK